MPTIPLVTLRDRRRSCRVNRTPSAWHGVSFAGVVTRLVLVLICAGFAAAAGAQTVESADYVFVFPDPTGRNGEPDPAVWMTSSTSNIDPIPVQGSGLAIVDPDNESSLVYFHPTALLGGASNANNTATFRARVRTPPVDDQSPAWVDNAIGWRLFLDDGSHRAELLLCREASLVARVLFEP